VKDRQSLWKVHILLITVTGALRCPENIISSVPSVVDEMRRGAKSQKLSQLLGRADSSFGGELLLDP
jgi:hypothetical protein